MTVYKGDAGVYYKDIFSMKHPCKSFAGGLAASYNAAFRDLDNLYSGANSAIGVPTWKFDVQIGIYMDFIHGTVTNPNTGVSQKRTVFSGMGAYVGAQVGFKKAWYTILPVVFIPAYIGLEINANALGFMGSERTKDNVEMLFEDATKDPEAFSKVDEFNGAVKFGICFNYTPVSVWQEPSACGFRVR